MSILHRAWKITRRLVGWTLGLMLMMVLLRNSTIPLGSPYYAVATHVKDVHFDYIEWETQAIVNKLQQATSNLQTHMTEAERTQAVRTYIADLARAQQIEADVAAMYADPSIEDPETTSADLRAERDALRESLRNRQTLVEAILEGQVASVLVDEGFGVAGQLMPPMSMRFSQRAEIVVVSPRDAIELDIVITVDPLPVDQRDRIENRIEAEQDMAAVVVPIGGMALYPAMIIETTSIPYIVETFAHEWLHHYLFFHPLGYGYELFNTQDTRIINETTASIFGREIGRKVLERYYPDLAPPRAPLTEVRQMEPRFDYGTEMHETRLRVDALLDEGKIEEAEAYMEQRRQLFVENGIQIRRLNQAWFAFYGGYQVSGISAGGDDPIGPAVQAIRDASPSAKDWILSMRSITTREQLLDAQEAIENAQWQLIQRQ